MGLKKDLENARTAVEKLNTYSSGVFAAGGRDATQKYDELNSKADKAIRKLPKGLRSAIAVDLLGKKKP